MDTAVSSKSEDTKRFIAEAGSVHRELARFAGSQVAPQHFVPLGENCTPAWYLKQLGLKTHSYTFDWAFSSPEIVLHCLEDDFKTLLSRSKMTTFGNGQSGGHAYYHTRLFMHRNPRKDRQSYQYYVRCCDRLRERVRSAEATVYLLLMVNEPEKRPIWAEGFTSHFPMPFGQHCETTEPLLEYLRTHNPNARMVVIDHVTEVPRTIAFERNSDHACTVRFGAGGKSNGKEFVDSLDDFCFKLALSGLCQ